jgi:hypothetical protein
MPRGNFPETFYREGTSGKFPRGGAAGLSLEGMHYRLYVPTSGPAPIGPVFFAAPENFIAAARRAGCCRVADSAALRAAAKSYIPV